MDRRRRRRRRLDDQSNSWSKFLNPDKGPTFPNPSGNVIPQFGFQSSAPEFEIANPSKRVVTKSPDSEKETIFNELSGGGGRGELGIGGIGKLGKRGVVEVVDLDDEEGGDLGTAIDLKLFEKWGGKRSEDLKMGTGLSLVSDFANEKMMWERVVGRVRFEGMDKSRFCTNRVNWREWFLKKAKEDVRERIVRRDIPHVAESWWLEYVKSGRKAGVAAVGVKEGGKVEEYVGEFGEVVKRVKKQGENGLGEWRIEEGRVVRGKAPALAELAFAYLAEYAEGMVSLENVPVEIRDKLSRAVCDYGKMNCEFMKLLVDGAPTEICVPDCSWMKTKEFVEIFQDCDTRNLKVCPLSL